MIVYTAYYAIVDDLMNELRRLSKHISYYVDFSFTKVTNEIPNVLWPILLVANTLIRKLWACHNDELTF